jgi:hypothetical protein
LSGALLILPAPLLPSREQLNCGHRLQAGKGRSCCAHFNTGDRLTLTPARIPEKQKSTTKERNSIMQKIENMILQVQARGIRNNDGLDLLIEQSLNALRRLIQQRNTSPCRGPTSMRRPATIRCWQRGTSWRQASPTSFNSEGPGNNSG